MADKAETVAALHARFGVVKGAVVSDYRGLNVQEMSTLRRRLREVDVELHVVKNTLARRAAVATDFEHIVDSFVGPTSIAFTEGDVVAMSAGRPQDRPASTGWSRCRGNGRNRLVVGSLGDHEQQP